MNLYEKLIEIRKTCPYLKKDNKGYQFQYVSSSQTLGSLREAMDQHKVLLVPCVTQFEVRDHQTKKGDHQYLTILTMDFTWVDADNPEDRITMPWVGQGLDDGEKGVGKALTYAEKYFMLKFFNIATDKDDPDSFQQKNNGGALALINDKQLGVLRDFIISIPVDESKFLEFLGVPSLEQTPAKLFNKAHEALKAKAKAKGQL